jgi:hypothetical protein
MWSLVIKSVTGMVTNYFQNRASEQRAKHEAMLKHMDQQAVWEITQAEASKTSWKDEWFVLVLSVPLVCAFIPPWVPYIEQGFIVLELMPDYYKAFLGGAIAASFGLKTLTNWGKTH